MGRRVQPGPQTMSGDDGRCHAGRGRLAVGAADVDDRVVPLGVPQEAQQPPTPIQARPDALADEAVDPCNSLRSRFDEHVSRRARRVGRATDQLGLRVRSPWLPLCPRPRLVPVP